jgi:hypothetical protein
MPDVDLSFLESSNRGNPNLAAVRAPSSVMHAAAAVKRTPRGEKKSRSCAEIVRKFITSRKHLDEKGQIRFVAMLENMVNIACSKSPQAVAAFTAIKEAAYGKARPHDDALDALAKGGIQIVYVAPTELDNSEPVTQHHRLPPKPDFLEAEFTEAE